MQIEAVAAEQIFIHVSTQWAALLQFFRAASTRQSQSSSCSPGRILSVRCHVGTARLDSLNSLDKVERVESCRDEPSGIWSLQCNKL